MTLLCFCSLLCKETLSEKAERPELFVLSRVKTIVGSHAIYSILLALALIMYQMLSTVLHITISFILPVINLPSFTNVKVECNLHLFHFNKLITKGNACKFLMHYLYLSHVRLILIDNGYANNSSHDPTLLHNVTCYILYFCFG